MLASVDSRELSEWQAYERHAGPVDGAWRDETLSQVHELLQYANYLTGAVNTPKGKENKVPEVQHYKRPHELATDERT